MGRSKLSLELISKEKSRNTTFQKRKKGLKKKIYEFSTLCGVDACLIIYGPKHGDRPVEPEIWPENSGEVVRIINRYNEHSKEEREKRNLNLSDFFLDRKKKAEEELSKLRRNNEEAYYSFQTGDDQINDFKEDQLWELVTSLDGKLKFMRTIIGSMKEKQGLMEQEAATMIEYCSLIPQQNQNPSSYVPGMYQRSMGLDHDMHQQQPISWVNPLDRRFPNDYPCDQKLMYNPSPMATSMNGMDYPHTQFSGGSSSNLHYNCPPLEGPANGAVSAMSKRSISDASFHQFNEFYDFQDVRMKHRMARFYKF
ncbi:hypothetical protein HHK36_031080 [Tetracentron sinense]|uniref:MADS-box domain-containing protein n=1 Tax=Tetracentron sinense TaxID=13715 RepID=A0A835D1C1_TETSI|nr:hypothetical protein HHK36_031080 [Tetracentron sinense]